MAEKHKVTFWMPEDLWKLFSKKCIDLGKTRTNVIIELVEKFLKKE